MKFSPLKILNRISDPEQRDPEVHIVQSKFCDVIIFNWPVAVVCIDSVWKVAGFYRMVWLGETAKILQTKW